MPVKGHWLWAGAVCDQKHKKPPGRPWAPTNQSPCPPPADARGHVWAGQHRNNPACVLAGQRLSLCRIPAGAWAVRSAGTGAIPSTHPSLQETWLEWEQHRGGNCGAPRQPHLQSPFLSKISLVDDPVNGRHQARDPYPLSCS